MNIDPQDIKVKIKLLKGGGKILAQANVTLFDCWTEHGWRIMTSQHLNQLLQEYVWIQPPCFKIGDQWKEMVFIDDKRVYEKLHEKIFDSYKLAKYKEPLGELGEAERVFNQPQTDEIPF